MVDVEADPRRGAAGAERGGKFRRDALGRDDRHAGVEAHHLHMADRADVGDQRGDAARSEDERIAARDDDLEDFRPRADIGERRGDVLGRHRAALPDRLAAEAEAAVDRARGNKLQKHAVGIAVDEAGRDLMRVVADRVGALVRRRRQFGRRQAGTGARSRRSHRSGSISAAIAGVIATA